MRYRALATDYDGTIAHDGVVDDATVQALQQAREAGLKLVLVTGRELSSLFNTFAHPDAFDRIVAENGAVVYEPGTKEVRTLASPPPPALIDMLQSGQVPLEIGHSIVATVTPHEHAVLEAIRALKIEWHVIFNKHAVMALPADVTKATGLTVALRELDVSAEETVGVGDAENDQSFLRLVGLSAAVANALAEVKALADVTTGGRRGEGVRELIEQLLGGHLDAVAHRTDKVPPA